MTVFKMNFFVFLIEIRKLVLSCYWGALELKCSIDAQYTYLFEKYYKV